MKKMLVLMAAVSLLGLNAPHAWAAADGARLFKAKCKICHAVDRKKVGPALKAMNKDSKVLYDTIINGRKMMPPFGKKLDAAEVDALVAYIHEQQGANAGNK